MTKHSQDKMNPQDLMLQYSIVTRMYRDPENKRVAYLHLTDGFVHVAISPKQQEDLLKQAAAHQRYEIGAEVYIEPTGEIDLDGYLPEKNLKLESVVFRHVFISAAHYDEIFQEYKTDRKITFLNKSELIKGIHKAKSWINKKEEKNGNKIQDKLQQQSNTVQTNRQNQNDCSGTS